MHGTFLTGFLFYNDIQSFESKHDFPATDDAKSPGIRAAYEERTPVQTAEGSYGLQRSSNELERFRIQSHGA